MAESGIFSCCPCGMFKLRSNTRAQPSEKYKVTMDEDNHRQVVVNNDDDDDGRYIVPLDHNDTVVSENSVTVKSNPSQQMENEEDLFTSRFQEVSDSDGEVDAWQLRDLLNQCFPDVEFKGFSLDVCRSMVALGDNNLSGQMSYGEARQMYDELLKWKEAYQTFDTDRSGFFRGQELQKLLESLGYDIDPKTVHAMAVRYSDKEDRIYYVDFVSCLLKFTSMYEAYHYKQNNNDPSFSTDEFIQLTMYS